MIYKLKALLFFIIIFCSLLFFVKISAAQAAGPVLFFSDLTSGPKTGWEGSATKGAAVTIWGKNFGTTRGSNYVTVNGAQITEYAEWGVTGTANGIPRGLERITFWLNSNCADGAGTISITIGGITSNTLPFTVRSGRIFFISVTDGSNSYNGQYSTRTGHTGSDGPWKDFYTALNQNNSIVTAGATIYVKGGTYTTGDPSENTSFLDFRSMGDAGTSANPIVLTAYPGEVPIANLSGKGHGFSIGDSGCDTGQGCQNYWTIAKIKMINGSMGPNIRSHHVNIVGCWFSGITGGGWSGIIDSDVGSYVNLYGNYFYNCGNTDGDAAYTHTIYLNGTQGTLSNYNVRYNEFDHDTYASYYGGELDIRAANHIDISENYWHDGSNQPLYLSAEGGSISYIYFYNNIASNMNIIPSATDPASTGEYCLHLNDLDSTSRIYNNTLYNCPINPSEAVIGVYGAFSSHSNVTSANNIIYGSSPSQPALYIESNGTFNSTNDLYYNVTVPSGSGVTMTGARITNPLFVANGSDFHLQSSNPAIDAGTSAVSSIVATDYDFISRPQGSGYDIGAYEYVSGTPVSDTQAPTTPTNLSATAVSPSQINLSWTASTDNVGVTGYRIYRGGTQIATSNTTSYQNTGLTANTAYSYTVAAYDAAGNVSSQSSSASAITQAAPAGTINLIQTAGNSGSGTSLSTSINSSGASNLIVVCVSSGQPPTSIADNKQNLYTLAKDMIYGTSRFQLYYAYNTTGGITSVTISSPWTSNEMIVAEYSGIAASNPLDSTAGYDNVYNGGANWTSGNSAATVQANELLIGCASDRYGIASSFTAGTNYIARRTQSSLFLEDRNVSAVGAYAAIGTHNAASGYEIEAIIATFKAAAGASTDTIAPSVPANLTATAISSSQINLAWTASTDNVSVTGYRIFRGGVQIGTSATNLYSDTSLSPSTAYSYTVAAYDAVGNISGQSASASATTQAGTTKRGDLNNDGRVDDIDLRIFIINWGNTSRPPADINQDGQVDIIDLRILVSNWG